MAKQDVRYVSRRGARRSLGPLANCTCPGPCQLRYCALCYLCCVYTRISSEQIQAAPVSGSAQLSEFSLPVNRASSAKPEKVSQLWVYHTVSASFTSEVTVLGSFVTLAFCMVVTALTPAENDKAVAAFGELGICRQLAEAAAGLGWKTPSSIQTQAIPHLLQDRDIIGLAQTGSGKTGAFALPILEGLLKKPQALYAMVLSPTRELAIQIAEQFEALGSGVGVKCAVLVGGIDMMAQAIALGRRPHVIVGTPGRVVDHLSNTKGFSLKLLKHLVLDEADRLLNMDFEQEIDQILKAIPKERRTQLFSATMTNKVAKLQRACLIDPVKVEVAQKYSTVDTLRQQYLFIPAKYKDCYLAYYLTELAGATFMIFTRTCDNTRKMALMLRNLGFDAIPIHGQMAQAKRIGSLNKFKAGERSILVATDVASRGLDIPAVDCVVNYDVPTNSKDYIHRVGRTARAGRSGRSLTLVTQYDVELFQKIEALTGHKMEEYPAEQEAVLLLLERVGEAQRISTMQMRESEKRKGSKRKGHMDDDTERHAMPGMRKPAKQSRR